MDQYQTIANAEIALERLSGRPMPKNGGEADWVAGAQWRSGNAHTGRYAKRAMNKRFRAEARRALSV